MKDLLKLIVIIVLTSVMFAILLMGCNGGFTYSTASISEATMTSLVDEDAKPLNPTDVFPVDAPEIHCSFKLSNAPDDTEVLAEWIYVRGEMPDLVNYHIDDWTETTGGTRYVDMYMLLPPDTAWPRGDYKVILYIDSKEKLSVPFQVE